MNTLCLCVSVFLIICKKRRRPSACRFRKPFVIKAFGIVMKARKHRHKRFRSCLCLDAFIGIKKEGLRHGLAGNPFSFDGKMGERRVASGCFGFARMGMCCRFLREKVAPFKARQSAEVVMMRRARHQQQKESRQQRHRIHYFLFQSHAPCFISVQRNEKNRNYALSFPSLQPVCIRRLTEMGRAHGLPFLDK